MVRVLYVCIIFQQSCSQDEKYHENPDDRPDWIQMELIETPEAMGEVGTRIISPSNHLVSWVNYGSALQAAAAS